MLLVQKLSQTQMPYRSSKISGWAGEQECETHVCGFPDGTLLFGDIRHYLGGLQESWPWG